MKRRYRYLSSALILSSLITYQAMANTDASNEGTFERIQQEFQASGDQCEGAMNSTGTSLMTTNGNFSLADLGIENPSKQVVLSDDDKAKLETQVVELVQSVANGQIPEFTIIDVFQENIDQLMDNPMLQSPLANLSTRGMNLELQEDGTVSEEDYNRIIESIKSNLGNEEGMETLSIGEALYLISKVSGQLQIESNGSEQNAVVRSGQRNLKALVTSLITLVKGKPETVANQIIDDVNNDIESSNASAVERVLENAKDRMGDSAIAQGVAALKDSVDPKEYAAKALQAVGEASDEFVKTKTSQLQIIRAILKSIAKNREELKSDATNLRRFDRDITVIIQQMAQQLAEARYMIEVTQTVTQQAKSEGTNDILISQLEQYIELPLHKSLMTLEATIHDAERSQREGLHLVSSSDSMAHQLQLIELRVGIDFTSKAIIRQSLDRQTQGALLQIFYQQASSDMERASIRDMETNIALQSIADSSLLESVREHDSALEAINEAAQKGIESRRVSLQNFRTAAGTTIGTEDLGVDSDLLENNEELREHAEDLLAQSNQSALNQVDANAFVDSNLEPIVIDSEENNGN